MASGATPSSSTGPTPRGSLLKLGSAAFWGSPEATPVAADERRAESKERRADSKGSSNKEVRLLEGAQVQEVEVSREPSFGTVKSEKPRAASQDSQRVRPVKTEGGRRRSKTPVTSWDGEANSKVMGDVPCSVGGTRGGFPAALPVDSSTGASPMEAQPSIVRNASSKEDSSPMMASAVPSIRHSWRQAASPLARWCPCLPCMSYSSRGLTRGVEVNEDEQQDEELDTLLSAARGGTEEQALEMFSTRSSDEDLSEADFAGRTAFHHAARRGPEDCASCEISFGSVWRGFLELCCAITGTEAPPGWPSTQTPTSPTRSGDSEGGQQKGKMMQLLRSVTQARLDWVNVRDINGSTALHAAAQEGRSEICSWMLLESRFTLADRQDNVGQTALHAAAGHGHAEACLALLEACRNGRFTSTFAFGAAMAKDDNGRTALHTAADMGHPEACNLLCNHKRMADALLTPDKGGWLPLHCAAGSGHTDVVKVLCENARPVGGILEARDVEGRTPLHLAALADKPVVCIAILEYWVSVRVTRGELRNFVRIAYHTLASDPATVSASHSGANARDVQGRTALHLAARAGATRACEALLAHPAFDAVSAVDNRGRTAADVATGKARRLLARAADELRAFRRDWC